MTIVLRALGSRSPRSRLAVKLRCDRLEDRTVPASFQGLGDLPGGTFNSIARGVSADGSVVVGDSYIDSGIEAFRWTLTGTMAGLGFLPGGNLDSHALGVSADGSAIAGYGESATALSGFEAFRWTMADGMVGLGGLPGWTTSVARGISGDGSVVVGQSSPFPTQAFRWTAPPGGMVSLGHLPAGVGTDSATGASENGSVIVGYSIASPSLKRAFRWTAASDMVDLGFLPGGDQPAEANGVSADGTVVVGDCYDPSRDEAFRWTQAGGMIGLGFLPGGMFSRAYAASEDGSVVVGDASNSSNQGVAMRWTAASGVRSVRDILVNDYGLSNQLTGWSLNVAYSCSADGRTIVGSGTDPAGNSEAWIARLDAPPRVAATQVNDGSVQRSRVTDLTVRFDSQVTFSGAVADAFTIMRVGGGSVSFTASANVVGGVTVVTLANFSGSDTQFGSLADGRYTLTALSNQISGPGGALDGDGDGQAGGNYTFGDAQGLFRFYGDVNGDQTVNGFDLGFFRNAFGTQTGDSNYLSYLDLNGDGVINGFDLGQFRTRFGTVLP